MKGLTMVLAVLALAASILSLFLITQLQQQPPHSHAVPTAAADHSHEIDSLTGVAAADHSHEGYAMSDHSHEGLAAADHTHDGFAPAEHAHEAETNSSDTQ